ncbi:MAG: phosphotransferase, partial [Candidatus Margulisiibacteriota bacterium]
PVIPPLIIQDNSIFEFGNIFFTIFPKIGGRAVDELDKEAWALVGRLLARTHTIGATLQGSQRAPLTPAYVTEMTTRLLLNSDLLPADFRKPFEQSTHLFLKIASPLLEKEPRSLIHGDCHLGNLLHRPGEGIFLVDFDDCCIGSPAQDLWMLLPGTPEECLPEIEWFLEGYSVFRDFPLSSLKTIPFLRIMRRLHYAGWCAMQRHDLGFHSHFPEWGSPRYWNELIRDIQSTLY